MTFTGVASQSGKYVCSACIDDFVVKAEIESGGRRRTCSYCKSPGRSVAIEQVADRVDDVYSAMVGEVEYTPHFPDDSDKVESRQDGSLPSQIVTEMLECAYDSIAEDIVGELSDRHGQHEIMDGGTDRYDDSNDIFEISIPRSSEIKETWQSFCYSVRHSRRYFNEEATDLLREILDPILSPQGPGKESAVKEIAAGANLYRGRMANTTVARQAILAKPINELGASPKELNTHGRMNAAGIPVFYGSFDAKTCVAELRGPVGGTAAVGKFETLRPLRVLDLTLLRNAMFNISYFDDEVVRKFAYNRFLRGFHKEIKKSVIPGTETLDYLPTQFVAEYLWTKVDPPLDGLIYGSAQISDAAAKNIALFPHACTAEGWYEELHPKKDVVQEPAEVVEDFVDTFSEPILEGVGVEAADATASNATLRLLQDETLVIDIRGIAYDVHERSARSYEFETRYGDGDDDEDYEDLE
jgi:DNA-directed RNA polymerase subunit RPC12/RpoP